MNENPASELEKPQWKYIKIVIIYIYIYTKIFLNF